MVGWFIFLQLIIIQCGIRIDTQRAAGKFFFYNKPEKSDDAILVLCTFFRFLCVAGLVHIFLNDFKSERGRHSLVKADDNDSLYISFL